MDAFADLTERVEAARPLRLGLLNARKTHALHRFAAGSCPPMPPPRPNADGSISTT
jgi:hypothetical protein